MSSFTAPPIDARPLRGATRVLMVFSGVEQAGASFEARVFLNNPRADEKTPRDGRDGFAGAFHVFGYGDMAPPDMAEAKAAKRVDDAAIAPIEKRVRLDDGVLQAAVSDADELTVTVVSVPVNPGDTAPARPFSRLGVRIDESTATG